MDYDIWYAGTIIGNLQAANDKQALKAANKQYSSGTRGSIAVSACSAAPVVWEAAKAASLIKPA